MARCHTDALAEYKAELDEICQGVMPDDWSGHGRLKIDERAFDDPSEELFAHRLLDRLSEKYPGKEAEVLAEKVIEKTEEKFD